ncbi:hypothetical protein LIER_17520 [Lithospermum erythrorhizon]|uniref:Uncharacterized protein n=1 Tax=Lithospermum erythrorhizon TaxID=34254 RepID=A0AAV3QAN4_LITER
MGFPWRFVGLRVASREMVASLAGNDRRKPPFSPTVPPETALSVENPALTTPRVKVWKNAMAFAKEYSRC